MEHRRQWKKMNGEPVGIPIAEEVKSALVRETAMGHELKIYIGTDSQVKNSSTGFATVIVFLRKGNGGFMYVCNERTTQKMNIKERMMTEVAKSIDVAYNLCEVFAGHDVPMEVHADINSSPAFKSNIALKDAMGYITGMGFTFKAKPLAFASSSCANKMVR
jgi:uncharacterized protein